MMFVTATNEWSPEEYSIGLCPTCPLVHFKFYKDGDPVMHFDIMVTELDTLIAQLIDVRNEAAMRPTDPVQPTHNAPEATQ